MLSEVIRERAVSSFKEMYFAFALFLCLFVARSSTEQSCAANGMLSCLMPLGDFFMGPVGLQMVFITDPLDFSEEHLTGLCRLGRGAIKCFHDYYDDCVQSMPDFRDFFGSLAELMQGCEQPGFYDKARILYQCMATLNQTRGKANACFNAATKMAMREIQKLRPTPSPMTGRYDLDEISRQFSGGQILDAMCCVTKFSQTCSGTEIRDKCGQDAQQVLYDFNGAFLNAYDCSQERLDRCPPHTDPSQGEYEYQNQLDLTELLAGSLMTLG